MQQCSMLTPRSSPGTHDTHAWEHPIFNVGDYNTPRISARSRVGIHIVPMGRIYMGSSRTTPVRHSDAHTSAVPCSKNTNKFGTGPGRPSAASAQVVGVELTLQSSEAPAQVVGVELVVQLVGPGWPASLPKVIIPNCCPRSFRGSEHKVS